MFDDEVEYDYSLRLSYKLHLSYTSKINLGSVNKLLTTKYYNLKVPRFEGGKSSELIGSAPHMALDELFVGDGKQTYHACDRICHVSPIFPFGITAIITLPANRYLQNINKLNYFFIYSDNLLYHKPKCRTTKENVLTYTSRENGKILL